MEEINGSWSRLSAALQTVPLLGSECASVVQYLRAALVKPASTPWPCICTCIKGGIVVSSQAQGTLGNKPFVIW